MLAPASLYLCILSRSDCFFSFSPVSVPGLLGPFPVKLQDGVRIWALASAVYSVWIFRNVTPSAAKCSKISLGGPLGRISGAPGGNLGRIWGESGWFRGDTDICGVYVMCVWCVCAAYEGCTWYACGVDVLCMWFFHPVTSLAGASPIAVPASYLYQVFPTFSKVKWNPKHQT